MKKIVIENLNKYYNKGTKNEIHVINNTTLSFESTGLVCLLGESGSGKTTLLNVMSGIDKYASGSIKVDGEVLKCNSSQSEPIKNNKFGYVFQNYYMLDNETVYENLRLALAPYNLSEDEVKSRINYVLEAVKMSKYIKRKLKNLSGGQAQRIAIARALVKAPDVIFADEPTGNLDEQTTLNVMSILKNISKKCLVIVATHERRIAEFFADRIISISDGKITSDRQINEVKGSYCTVDDHNLYLHEYDKVTLNNDLHNIDVYQNGDNKINIKIVCEHNKFYIVSDQPEKIQVINKTDNIQAIDSKKPVMDMQKVDELDYQLSKPNSVNTGVLSFKEILGKVFSNTKTKSYFIMIIALILISIISVIAVGDIMTVQKDDIKELLVEDSNVVRYDFEMKNYSSGVTFNSLIYELINVIEEETTYSDVTISSKINAHFEYEGFTEIENIVNDAKTIFNNFSYIDIVHLDETKLIYGRMPEKMYEVVIDKWVLESFMKESNIVAASMTKFEAFLNKTFYSTQTKTRFTIVGICETNSKCVYLDRIAYLNGSTNLFKVISLSQLQANFPGEYDDITLAKDETLVTSIQYKPGLKTANIGGKTFKVAGKFSYDNYKYVLSDEGIEEVFRLVIASDRSFNAYSKDHNEVEQIMNKIFNEANPEYEEFQKYIQYTSYNHYESVANEYYDKKVKDVQARLIVTAAIFIMCVATLFITMKAHANANMNSTMVYRLLGLKKGVVIGIYSLEILLASIMVMIPCSLLVVFVLEFIENMPASMYEFALTPSAYCLTMLGLFIINVIVGILPVVFIMRKTPAQLVSQYDI